MDDDEETILVFDNKNKKFKTPDECKSKNIRSVNNIIECRGKVPKLNTSTKTFINKFKSFAGNAAFNFTNKLGKYCHKYAYNEKCRKHLKRMEEVVFGRNLFNVKNNKSIDRLIIHHLKEASSRRRGRIKIRRK
jgi:hypothetical protein